MQGQISYKSMHVIFLLLIIFIYSRIYDYDLYHLALSVMYECMKFKTNKICKGLKACIMKLFILWTGILRAVLYENLMKTVFCVSFILSCVMENITIIFERWVGILNVEN